MVDSTSDGYDSADEGLQMMLGGIALGDISCNSWTHQDDSVASISTKIVRNKCNESSQKHGVTIDLKKIQFSDQNSDFFSRVHSISKDGQIVQPNIRIIDLVSL
jgi:uncharacterized membrane protein